MFGFAFKLLSYPLRPKGKYHKLENQGDVQHKKHKLSIEEQSTEQENYLFAEVIQNASNFNKTFDNIDVFLRHFEGKTQEYRERTNQFILSKSEYVEHLIEPPPRPTASYKNLAKLYKNLNESQQDQLFLTLRNVEIEVLKKIFRSPSSCLHFCFGLSKKDVSQFLEVMLDSQALLIHLFLTNHDIVNIYTFDELSDTQRKRFLSKLTKISGPKNQATLLQATDQESSDLEQSINEYIETSAKQRQTKKPSPLNSSSNFYASTNSQTTKSLGLHRRHVEITHESSIK
jgi:hypothetical protein